MATLNEIAYNIRNITRSGISNDDDRMTIRQIKFWIKYHRAFLVKQIAANRGYLEPQYFQDMGVVELTEVDKSSDKDGTIHNWDCIIKTAEVPRIVDLNRNRGIAFIGLIDKQTPITITTPNVVGFAKYKKFTNKMVRAYFINDQLYIEAPRTLDDDLKYINIRAIFEDPMEVNFCSEEGGCSCLTADDEFPMPSNAIEILTETALAKGVGPLVQSVNDEINDARELQTRATTETQG